MQSPPVEEEHPRTSPSLTSTPTPPVIPDILPWSDMPSPESYYRSSYQHSRNGPGGSASIRYPQSQYPSPIDSNSSRGHHSRDVEMASVNGRQYNSRRASVGNTQAFSPNNTETDSLEYPPSFPVAQSPRYPTLHFLLAQDSARANMFALDMRVDPQDSVSSDILETYGILWVTRDRPVHVRIISREFPWVIDIQACEPLEGLERGVTCGDVWSHLYSQLHEPINDTDWAYLSDMAARDPVARRRQEHLIGIARQQTARGEIVSLIRLDWLMRKTIFMGVERDENYSLSARRLLPGTERCAETWIADFSEYD